MYARVKHSWYKVHARSALKYAQLSEKEQLWRMQTASMRRAAARNVHGAMQRDGYERAKEMNARARAHKGLDPQLGHADVSSTISSDVTEADGQGSSMPRWDELDEFD